MEVLSLVEYERLDLDELDSAVAERLRDEHGSRIEIRSPWENRQKWGLTSLGWVGFLPVTPEFGLSLQPKVPLASLFRMLEVAYRLAEFRTDGLFDASSVDDLFELLASILARRVLDRVRHGLYRAYVEEERELRFLRGRLDLLGHARTPWRIALPCRFEEHTPDLDDNQLLLWTLLRIARSGLCRREESAARVRRACKALGGIVSVAPFIGSDATGRIYHQLNADYEPLHALCRFFLDHLGPAHELGDRPMLPFLVDMARLFEEFVAEWLSSHLPPYLAALPQEKVPLGTDRQVRFEIDIEILHLPSGRTVAVLDTKYKNQGFPQSADVQQAIAYAEARNCHHAFLVYPQELESPFRGELKNHTVETLAFPLDGDLDAAGERFLEQLLTRLEPKVAALEAGA